MFTATSDKKGTAYSGTVLIPLYAAKLFPSPIFVYLNLLPVWYTMDLKLSGKKKIIKKSRQL